MTRSFRQLLPAALFAILTPAAPLDAQPGLAIIIDDLGYGLDQGARVAGLPGPVAAAILPGTPRGADVARLVHRSGKEVLLHLPLQSVGQHDAPEPGGIGLDTSRGEFAALLARHLAAIPHVAGVNNHMGSLLTRHPGHMQWLMEELDARPSLFFVDSYTTRYSIALDAAFENGIPAVRRDVFLDSDDRPETVAREFERALTLARRNGHAIAIGHPYPGTLAYLEEALPTLSQRGVRLVSLRSIIDARRAAPLTSAAASGPALE